jgi:LPXTG-site transpeptidase (sortase) family protein
MEISRRGLVKLAGVGTVGAALGQLFGGGRADAAATLGTVRIAKLKLNKPVYSGTTNRVLNRGGFGHWVGSAKPGKSGHAILFAHRTSAGGPLRNAHKLKIGDVIVAGGVTYRVRAKEIVKSNAKRKALSYGKSGRRLSLITCTKPNGLPTSTKYRLIIRATA